MVNNIAPTGIIQIFISKLFFVFSELGNELT